MECIREYGRCPLKTEEAGRHNSVQYASIPQHIKGNPWEAYGIMRHVLDNSSTAITGTGAVRVRLPNAFDLSGRLPLFDYQKNASQIIHELLWFLKRYQHQIPENQQRFHLRDEWADENGDLGPVLRLSMAQQRTDGRHIDQIAPIVEQIKKNPDSRRLIVSAWNPAGRRNGLTARTVGFYVCNGCLTGFTNTGTDACGVPFFIFIRIVDRDGTSVRPGNRWVYPYVWRCAFVQQPYWAGPIELSRDFRKLPTMKINPVKTLFEFKFEDFELEGYDPHHTSAVSGGLKLK